MKKFLTLNDIDAYRDSFHLSTYVWNVIDAWDYFAKDTVGKQFVKSVDSISANIAEGFGRYTKKDKVMFYRYSYGSIIESLDWNEKAERRMLITKVQYDHIFKTLKSLPRAVHQLIKFTNEKLTM